MSARKATAKVKEIITFATAGELAQAKASLASPPPLPAWDDNDAMKAWVNTMLDRIDAVELEELFAETDRTFVYDPGWYRQHALRVAEERGDVEPLRGAYPHLAKYLQRPKLDRGKHFPKVNYSY